MSARRTHSARHYWRDEEDDERRSRKVTASSRDHHLPSPSYPRRSTVLEFNVKPARRELNGDASSRRSKHRHQDESVEVGRSGRLSSSTPPHRGSTVRKSAVRDLSEEQASYRSRHRNEPSTYHRRPRSPSPSTSRAHLRKRRRTHSRSPHQADHHVHHRHLPPRGRSSSLEHSLVKHQHSRKRKHADAANYRSSNDNSPSPPPHRRARSPLPRHEPSRHRHRERSPPERPLKSPKREASPDRYPRRKSHRASRRSSPAEPNWGGEEGFPSESYSRRALQDKDHTTSSKYNQREPPLQAQPLFSNRTTRSRQESLEGRQTGDEAKRPRLRSASPSRGSSSKYRRTDSKASQDYHSPPPSGEMRRNGTMSDTFGRSVQPSSAEGLPKYRQDEGPPPSPPRPIPSFTDTDERFTMDDNTHLREAFPMHGMKASEVHQGTRPTSRPRIDTRRTYSPSPQYMTPTSAHHVSPQPVSPYSNGRGWGGQHGSYQGQPPQTLHQYNSQPSYRTNSYPPQAAAQGSYHQNHPPHHGQYSGPYGQVQAGYQQQPHRGHPHSYRGNNFSQVQDRRFSGSGAQSFQMPSQRRGGHFTNLHWNANSLRTRTQKEQQPAVLPHQNPLQGPQSVSTTLPPQATSDHVQGELVEPEEPEDNPFRPSKDLRVEDQSSKDESNAVVAASEEQKMPPPMRPVRQSSQEKSGSKISFIIKSKAPPPPKTDFSQKMRELSSRREGPKPGETPRSQPSARSAIVEDAPQERREPRRERRILKRPKPRPTLPAEFASSESVYFRKPGNESVVGSGTYGKVFKAIHVYTKDKVALKKIRMEGERDGFPVTAIREIKLLQSLRHENIVRLQEVMVEKNDCYMVFEYLSHDLTGLLNHPTFKLEQAHKKHLARQLFEGLDHLHRRGVLHRDIKAANILISNEGQLKLADFGLARFFAKRRQLDYTNRVITIWYRSPELLLGETQYGPAVDIWSAACVLIEIFTKHAIFPGDGGEINQLNKIYNILGTPTKTDWPDITEMAWFELLRPSERKANVFAEKYKERLTPAAFELLCAMFQYDPAKRPAASDVLEHPYFTTEEPSARQATELRDLEGDWHEFESKALRKENERRDKEARRASGHNHQHHTNNHHHKDVAATQHHAKESRDREREKRRASMTATSGGMSTEREAKRHRPE